MIDDDDDKLEFSCFLSSSESHLLQMPHAQAQPQARPQAVPQEAPAQRTAQVSAQALVPQAAQPQPRAQAPHHQQQREQHHRTTSQQHSPGPQQMQRAQPLQQPAYRAQHIPQSFQQARPGPPPAVHLAQPQRHHTSRSGEILGCCSCLGRHLTVTVPSKHQTRTAIDETPITASSLLFKRADHSNSKTARQLYVPLLLSGFPLLWIWTFYWLSRYGQNKGV